jgi:hypothetical protein
MIKLTVVIEPATGPLPVPCGVGRVDEKGDVFAVQEAVDESEGISFNKLYPRSKGIQRPEALYKSLWIPPGCNASAIFAHPHQACSGGKNSATKGPVF